MKKLLPVLFALFISVSTLFAQAPPGGYTSDATAQNPPGGYTSGVTGSGLGLSQAFFYEEFASGTGGDGTLGTYGWRARQIVGTTSGNGFVTGATAGAGPGVVQQVTQAVNGDGIQADLSSTGVAGFFGTLGANPPGPWTSSWRFENVTTTNVSFRVGYVTGGAATVVPTNGLLLRWDTELKNVASATCNDAGNKCGLTTLACSTNDTVTFSINGGTATGSVACTGTNAIANTTAITVTSAGKGYNSTGGAAVGTVTGGTAATKTGSIALTTTLGAAQSGADTHYNLCNVVSSLETCVETTSAPNGSSWFRVNIGGSATTVTMQLFDGSGNSVFGPSTFCSSSCTVTTTPTAISLSPAVETVTGTSGAAASTNIDFWLFSMTGLTR